MVRAPKWIWFIILLGVMTFSACRSSDTKEGAPVSQLSKIDSDPKDPKILAAIGKELVFGTLNPLEALARHEAPIGPAGCPLCHKFYGEQKADRCPNLVGEGQRSEGRPKEERYRKFSERYAEKGEPNTGIKPHATTGGEYLIESLYCPNCYVRGGFGIKGTGSTESPMFIISEFPIALTDFEIVAVVAYLQVRDTLGDYSKVTAQEDWERYFGKKLHISKKYLSYKVPPDTEIFDSIRFSPGDTVEQIILKAGCNACHTIPGIKEARGYDGPKLVLKSTAAIRLKSPEYQEAVHEGRAHATTEREYVMESILNPDAFIVPGYSGTMLKYFGQKLSPGAIDKIVDFLLTIGSADDELFEGETRHEELSIPAFEERTFPSDPEIMPRTIILLKDKTPGVRLKAVQTLARIGDIEAEHQKNVHPQLKTSVPALVEAAKQERLPEIRVELWRIIVSVMPDNKEAVQELMVLFKRKELDDFQRSRIVKTLAETGSVEMLPFLTDSLSEDYVFIREYAAIGLGRMGGKAKPAIPALIKALQIERSDQLSNQERAEILKALVRIDPASDQVISTIKDFGSKTPYRSLENLATRLLEEVEEGRDRSKED